jgi:hypothetical protein
LHLQAQQHLQDPCPAELLLLLLLLWGCSVFAGARMVMMLGWQKL